MNRQEIISKKAVIKEQLQNKRKQIAEIESEIKPLKAELRVLDKKLDELNYKKIF